MKYLHGQTEDDFDFEVRFISLKSELEAQLQEKAQLNKIIAENLNKIQMPGRKPILIYN